jgi:hypothetical protein
MTWTCREIGYEGNCYDTHWIAKARCALMEALEQFLENL